MKAHKKVFITESDVRREVKRETEEAYESIFRKCVDDVSTQLVASVFWTMHTRFGWGKKRLGYLLEALKDTRELMDNPSPLHHRFGPIECEKIIKDKYGIDVAKELPPQVEVKP